MWSIQPYPSRQTGARRTAVSLRLELLDGRCAPSSLLDATTGSSHSTAEASKTADVRHHETEMHSPTAAHVNPGDDSSSDLDGDNLKTSRTDVVANLSVALSSETPKKPKPGDSSTQSGSAAGVAAKEHSGAVIATASPTHLTSTTPDSAATPLIAKAGSKTVPAGKSDRHAGAGSETHASQNPTDPGKSNASDSHHTSSSTRGDAKSGQHSKDSPSPTPTDTSDGQSEGGPDLINFADIEECQGMMEFTGTVQDIDPADIYVAFSGIPSLQGKSTFTDADGNFDVAFIVNTDGSDDGIAMAQATDSAGLLSNIASCVVECS